MVIGVGLDGFAGSWWAGVPGDREMVSAARLRAAVIAAGAGRSAGCWRGAAVVSRWGLEEFCPSETRRRAGMPVASRAAVVAVRGGMGHESGGDMQQSATQPFVPVRSVLGLSLIAPAA